MSTREFIKSLGDNAATFFDVKPETIARWLKTGNVPVRAADKIFMAMNAAKLASVDPREENRSELVELSKAVTDIDPITHLPRNLNKRLPELQGKPPAVIEINPTEQSFGNNFTRPGRINTQPLPPMKLRRTEDGQVEAYIDNHPKSPTVIPPTIDSGVGWGRPTDVIDVRQDKKP